MGISSDSKQDGSDDRRPGIHTYEAPFDIYAMNWSIRKDKTYRLAISTLFERYQNRVEIVHLHGPSGEIRPYPDLSFDHPYPPTKLAFIPDKECQHPDLLASASDFLRLWRIPDEDTGRRVELKCALDSNRGSQFSGPLTSFDWNEAALRLVATASIDTTCTIWDIERETINTQLIAHDKEVYDVAWGSAHVFASVSGDGSVRVFDLRNKEHSQIVYENPDPKSPLIRIGWSNQDPRYMAAAIMDSSKVVVLDPRVPAIPVGELQRHQAPVNAVAWAPHNSRHICTAGSDSQALIWDLSAERRLRERGADPILSYGAAGEIEQMQWSSLHPDWIAVAFSNKLQILRDEPGFVLRLVSFFPFISTLSILISIQCSVPIISVPLCLPKQQYSSYQDACRGLQSPLRFCSSSLALSEDWRGEMKQGNGVVVGVGLLEGSWLGIGVISVPTSLIAGTPASINAFLGFVKSAVFLGGWIEDLTRRFCVFEVMITCRFSLLRIHWEIHYESREF